MFAEIVLVCIESDALQDNIALADPTHDAVLFTEGRRQGAGLSFKMVKSWQQIPEVLLELAHGPDGSRLKERAEAIRSKLEPATLAALERLGTPADKDVLVREAPRMIPLLVQARKDAVTPARQTALRDVIEAYCNSSNRSTPGPSLPFGLEAGPFDGGCGRDSCREQAPEDRRAVGYACGMAMVGPNARSFVRYLTR
jgi:hypothetical protein